STHWLKPMIQPRPLTEGNTASYGPTRVTSLRVPVKVVPSRLSCTNSSPRANSPRACRAAMRPQVPVPHGERSSTPVHVIGSFRSTAPFGTMTVLRPDAHGVGDGP